MQKEEQKTDVLNLLLLVSRIKSIFKVWNTKYELWALLTDFIFVVGVLVLDWSPVLLILLLMIDTGVMVLFANILFYFETKDSIRTFLFFISIPIFLIPPIGMYAAMIEFIEDIHLQNEINADPYQIINSYILPIVLVSSGLNHYANFYKGLKKIKNGTYKGKFIKLFFLRIVFIMSVMLVLAIGYYFFNATIVLALIVGKALLRIWDRSYRDII